MPELPASWIGLKHGRCLLSVVLQELVTLQVPLVGGLRDPEVPRECPQEVADAIKDCLQVRPSSPPTLLPLPSAPLPACPPAYPPTPFACLAVPLVEAAVVLGKAVG